MRLIAAPIQAVKPGAWIDTRRGILPSRVLEVKRINKKSFTCWLIVNTITNMHTTFDSAKDAANQAKHGVSLALASDLEWGSAVTWPDTRRVYGEPRQCGIGYIGLRLFFVAFVDRVDGRRIISLRKANSREVRRYAKT
jgi:uncharacterized protein